MKKAIRPFIAAALSAVLLVSSAGCSAAKPAESSAKPIESASAAESSSSAEKTYTFGYIAFDMKDLWNSYSAKAFEYAGEKLGVDTIV